MKKIIRQLKKQEKHLLRAWRFHNFIFTQDTAEDARFFKISRDKKVTELHDFPIKLHLEQPKQTLKLEGCDFMEYGNLIYGKE